MSSTNYRDRVYRSIPTEHLRPCGPQIVNPGNPVIIAGMCTPRANFGRFCPDAPMSFTNSCLCLFGPLRRSRTAAIIYGLSQTNCFILCTSVDDTFGIRTPTSANKDTATLGPVAHVLDGRGTFACTFRLGHARQISHPTTATIPMNPRTLTAPPICVS